MSGLTTHRRGGRGLQIATALVWTQDGTRRGPPNIKACRAVQGDVAIEWISPCLKRMCTSLMWISEKQAARRVWFLRHVIIKATRRLLRRITIIRSRARHQSPRKVWATEMMNYYLLQQPSLLTGMTTWRLYLRTSVHVPQRPVGKAKKVKEEVRLWHSSLMKLICQQWKNLKRQKKKKRIICTFVCNKSVFMYADLLLFCRQMTPNMSWQKVWQWLLSCDWTRHLKTPLAE